MRDYDLAKQHMATQMQQADNNRLLQQIKSTDAKPSSLLSRLRWSRSTSVSSEQINGVPAHQMTPSGTL